MAQEPLNLYPAAPGFCGGGFLNCVLNANSVYQVLFRIFHSSCWTTNLMISKQWFSDFFSSWDTLLQVYFWCTAPKSLLPPDFPFLYSCALLPLFLSACALL